MSASSTRSAPNSKFGDSHGSCLLASTRSQCVEVRDRGPRLRRATRWHRLATWTRPNGGYLLALGVLDGSARAVVRLTTEAGIAVAPARATPPMAAIRTTP
ncbi:hypothetical protein [Streptomyces sp. OE57]|uniref:hypothetical protein n=1 Tax=Streptomyces lacaronensis TaxID=3379885 RepID=UPI0039B721E6